MGWEVLVDGATEQVAETASKTKALAREQDENYAISRKDSRFPSTSSRFLRRNYNSRRLPEG